jgi:hypothetical protein
MTNQQDEPKGGCIAGGLMLFAIIGGIITLISAINVAFDLEWSLRVYGTRTKLPTDWFTVIAVAIICALAWGVSAIMTSEKVRNQFQKHRWLKWLTPIVITLVIVFGFYSVYYSMEYSGPMHYASRSNDIETVKEELKKDIDDSDYLSSVYECMELDHVEILALLLAHPHAEETKKGNFNYALEAGSMDVLLTFIDADVGYEGESGDFLAQLLAVSELSKEEKEIVGMKLLDAGANPDGVYTGGFKGTELTALDQAKEQGLTKLVNAMGNQ